jgi:hypothetical protein
MPAAPNAARRAVLEALMLGEERPIRSRLHELVPSR